MKNNKRKKDIIDKKLIPLDECACYEACDTLEHLDILTWSMYHLKSVDVPTKQLFELHNHPPVYQRPRRMSPKHNEIVEEEIGERVEAGIIVAFSSARSPL